MLTTLQRQILGAVNAAGGLSRTELAQSSGMSKAAIGGVVREMIEAGFLHEAETVPGSGQGDRRYVWSCILTARGLPVFLCCKIRRKWP